MTLVRIDVCCNDPDNGSFDGRAAAIQLQAGILELASDDFRGPVFREYPDAIRISRRAFRCRESKEWIGNWCWNAYWLEEAVAGEFIAYAHKIGRFSVEMGEERLFARWENRTPFDARDKEFFGRQMLKAAIEEQERCRRRASTPSLNAEIAGVGEPS